MSSNGQRVATKPDPAMAADPINMSIRHGRRPEECLPILPLNVWSTYSFVSFFALRSGVCTAYTKGWTNIIWYLKRTQQDATEWTIRDIRPFFICSTMENKSKNGEISDNLITYLLHGWFKLKDNFDDYVISFSNLILFYFSLFLLAKQLF